MSLVPLIEDRSARIAARKRLRMLSSAVVDDGIDRKREPPPPIGRSRESELKPTLPEPSGPEPASPCQTRQELLPQIQLPITYCDRKQPAIKDIINTVAAHYGLSPWEIISQRRYKAIIPPRQVTMYLANKLTLWSRADIGRKIGGRDHTTVIHGIRTIENQLPHDPALSERLAAIERDLLSSRVPVLTTTATALLPRDSVTAEQIKEAVSYYYGITEDYLVSKSVHAIPKSARQVAVYLTVEMTSLSIKKIHFAFKRKNSTHFPYAPHQFIKERRISGDPELEGDLAEILKLIRGESRS